MAPGSIAKMMAFHNYLKWRFGLLYALQKEVFSLFTETFHRDFAHAGTQNYTHITFPFFLCNVPGVLLRHITHSPRTQCLLVKKAHSATDAMGQAVPCWDNVHSDARDFTFHVTLNSTHSSSLPRFGIEFGMLSNVAISLFMCCFSCSTRSSREAMKYVILGLVRAARNKHSLLCARLTCRLIGPLSYLQMLTCYYTLTQVRCLHHWRMSSDKHRRVMWHVAFICGTLVCLVL